MKSVNKHISFLKVLLEMLKNQQFVLSFWDKTGVPDDAKMSQEEEPEEQEDSKHKEIKEKKERKERN